MTLLYAEMKLVFRWISEMYSLSVLDYKHISVLLADTLKKKRKEKKKRVVFQGISVIVMFSWYCSLMYTFPS